ncbi:unnamed protein product [Pseudo-nitzschia multistriata]|uniref:Fluoride ion transporter CrcB n=1 Tax=Pseudo-nitzschia multistriata TaxID=183589 RepID=A0A448Z095_9STRA|nr:unnamed protein product [Pseudo-nitzschia multistriata]
MSSSFNATTRNGEAAKSYTSSQQNQKQEQTSRGAELIPKAALTKYPPAPRDESEAEASFRRQAIDKAHESSAISWLQHIENHDADARYSRKLHRRTSSKDYSASFHSICAGTTLQKRRSCNSVISTTPKRITKREGNRPSASFVVSTSDNRGSNDVEMVSDVAAFDGLPSKRGSGKTDRMPKHKREWNQGASWEKYCTRHIQLLVSLAFFSYLGEFSRYSIDILFGGGCHSPGTIGWYRVGWHICTTDPGTTESTGGAFFVDLPTNVIGCFLMGLLVSGDGESIAVNLPVAALGRTCFFQNWVVTHVGLRTGFCGSLTTFASWNTQMVKMVVGNKGTALGYSQWVSALWGYIVGLYAALQSYQFGAAIAFALSRCFNPHLAREADKIIDKKAIGVLINRDLPDFERRFLHSIFLEESERHHHNDTNTCDEPRENLAKYGSSGYESFYGDHAHHLRTWKETTDYYRKGAGMQEESFVAELQEIEKMLLVDRIEPRQELLNVARDAGWDVGALRNWAEALDEEEAKLAMRNTGLEGNNDGDDGNFDIETKLEDAYFLASHSSPIEFALTLSLFLLTTGLLLLGFVYYSNPTESDSVSWRSYRTQCLAALLSPFGTYSRWYLSRLNGRIRHERWEWLPIGTFLANAMASVVSALMAAFLVGLNPEANPLAVVVCKAIQGGFAGSLSTVSTFATETVGLLQALPRAFWGYYYSFGSMLCAFVLGVASYAWFVV